MAGMNIGIPVRENAYQQALDELKSRQLNIDMSKMPNIASLAQGIAASQEFQNAGNNLQQVTSNTPQYDGIDVVSKPEESAYNYNSEFIDKYIEKPLDEEEKNKRIKGAYTKASVGALGNVLNSFSNLYFAGQGAPSQTLPQNPDAHGLVKDFKEEQRRLADNYLAKTMQARQLDRGEYAQDYDRYTHSVDARNALKKQEYADKVSAANTQYGIAKDRYANEKDDKRYNDSQEWKKKDYELEVDKFKNSKNLGWANYKLDKSYKDAQIANQKARIEAGEYKKAIKNGASSYKVLDREGNVYTFDGSVENDKNIAQLLEIAKAEYKKEHPNVTDMSNPYNYSVMGSSNDKNRSQDMRIKVADALQNYDSVRDAALSLDLLIGDSPMSGNVSQQGENYQDNWN